MKSLVDDIALYLPKYLSAEAQEELLIALKQFPENISSRLYTTALRHQPVLYQGDVFERVPLIDPNNKIKEVRAILISNTCDSDTENSRLYT